jgi:predicted nucleotidyltransferase
MRFDASPHAAALAAICRRFHVRRLDLFGSAARDDFDPSRSDIDLLVEYEPAPGPPGLDDFLALRESLSALFQRPVDLTMASALENPYLIAAINAERRPLHGA